MKNLNNFARYEKYTTDDVIKRGYAIYDEWRAGKLSSRQIVTYVESAVSKISVNKTKAASIEALACLFALDKRIKEKYISFFRKLFSYLAWKREKRALKLLKSALNLSDKNKDVRALIETELMKLDEMPDAEGVDGEDDEVSGGKRNSKAETETEAAEERMQEQTKDESRKENSENKDLAEPSEENTEQITRQESTEKKIENPGEKNSTTEIKEKNELSSAPKDEKKQKTEREQVKIEERSEIKKENNGTDKKAEPLKDKITESATQTETLTPPSQFNDPTRIDPVNEKIHFIDEVIIDNMVKGKEDFVRHNPLNDLRQGGENSAANFNETSISADKNAHLYDKMMNSDTAQQTDKAPVVNPEQPSAEKNGAGEVVREPLKIDVTLSSENEMRREISNNMSEEAIKAIYNRQAEIMREQLSIASADLGIDAPVEIIGRPDDQKTERSISVTDVK